MKFKSSVKSSLSDHELEQLIIRYFEVNRFKLIKKEDRTLIFKKGSLAKNMITFNPLNWKSSLTVIIDDSKIDYSMNVDPTFQAVTKQGEKVWETFVSNFHATIEGGVLSNQKTKETLKANKRSLKIYILYAILGGILLVIPSAILSYYTGITLIVSIGAASGALGFLYWKIEKEKTIQN